MDVLQSCILGGAFCKVCVFFGPELTGKRSHQKTGKQRRRAIEALEARAPPQYCDCGPDWPLLLKVHEI